MCIRDRLKAYSVDRTQLSTRLPRLLPDNSQTDKANSSNQSNRVSVRTDNSTPSSETDTSPEFEPARKIIRERAQKGKKEFLVLFQDGSTFWCDDVTPLLLQKFRFMQARRRKRDRQRRK